MHLQNDISGFLACTAFRANLLFLIGFQLGTFFTESVGQYILQGSKKSFSFKIASMPSLIGKGNASCLDDWLFDRV